MEKDGLNPLDLSNGARNFLRQHGAEHSEDGIEFIHVSERLYPLVAFANPLTAEEARLAVIPCTRVDFNLWRPSESGS